MRCWVSKMVRRRGFRWVCGDHRRDERSGQRIGHGRRIQFGGVEFEICSGETAVLRWLACRDVYGPAAFAVDVLGDVGQQREVGEGADDGDGPMDVDAVEHACQLGAVDLRASHPERLDARPLDEVENFLAVLLPNRVSEDCSEQPDVLPHRFGCLAAHLGAPHRTDRCQRDVGDFGHRSSIGAGLTRRMARALVLNHNKSVNDQPNRSVNHQPTLNRGTNVMSQDIGIGLNLHLGVQGLLLWAAAGHVSGLVIPGGVDGELADQFAGGGGGCIPR
jgi:hypothetical protein